jgi:hypothetical protein
VSASQDSLILRSRRSRRLEGSGQLKSHPTRTRPVARSLGSEQLKTEIIMSAKEVKFGVDAHDRMLRGSVSISGRPPRGRDFQRQKQRKPANARASRAG